MIPGRCQTWHSQGQRGSKPELHQARHPRLAVELRREVGARWREALPALQIRACDP
jgi:hypothetical protein